MREKDKLKQEESELGLIVPRQFLQESTKYIQDEAELSKVVSQRLTDLDITTQELSSQLNLPEELVSDVASA